MPEEIADRIATIRAKIDDEDLTEDGVEDDPHVTVKYGLHTDSTDDVRGVLDGEKSFEITLGSTSLFQNDECDVVKIGVSGDGIHSLNKKVCELPHTDSFPTYKPHVTLAYVKSGKGKKYDKMEDLDGVTVRIDKVVFSNKNRVETEIKLI